MATYYEFKKLICLILGDQVSDNNDDDICVPIAPYPYCHGNSERKVITITICDAELRHLFDEVSNYSFEKTELFFNNSYETAVDFDVSILHIRDKLLISPLVLNDTTNKVMYTLGLSSAEYCAALLIDAINKNRVFPHLPRETIEAMHYELLDLVSHNPVNHLSLQTVLSNLIHEVTLQIKTENKYSITDFQGYKTSFMFQFMYQFKCSLVEYYDSSYILGYNRVPWKEIDPENLQLPRRKYVSDVVDYYKLAMSAHDPYIEYISYYHVMEYFYDRVFKNKMTKALRDILTNPGFSYKDDDKVFELVKTVQKKNNANRIEGQGNESESLNYVLQEYIENIDELKNRISEIDSTALEYYKSAKINFCGVPCFHPRIQWNGEKDTIYATIRNRIYATRNSLVHSKREGCYSPYEHEHEEQLRKEIPLVKAVAELIIIHSGSIM